MIPEKELQEKKELETPHPTVASKFSASHSKCVLQHFFVGILEKDTLKEH